MLCSPGDGGDLRGSVKRAFYVTTKNQTSEGSKVSPAARVSIIRKKIVYMLSVSRLSLNRWSSVHTKQAESSMGH